MALLPWRDLSDFVLRCGTEKSPHGFGASVLDHVAALVPFDQGRLYFLSDNGCVSDMYLIGIGRQDVEEYFEYYHDVDNGEFSVRRLAHLYSTRYPSLDECIRDGSSYRQMQIGEYVAELGIKYSFGLGLWDAQGCLRCLYTLDRVCDVPFSQEEKETAYIAFQHLNQLFQNLCLMPAQNSPCPVSPQLLTKRENEIAVLLVKGITPAEISKRLCISFATVNKHLANMHRKLHVATRQELIVHLHQMGYL